MNPTTTQIAAALETLTAAGWRLTPPAGSRIQSVSVADACSLLGIGETLGRRLFSDASQFPGTFRVGSELRVLLRDVEAYQTAHRVSQEAQWRSAA